MLLRKRVYDDAESSQIDPIDEFCARRALLAENSPGNLWHATSVGWMLVLREQEGRIVEVVLRDGFVGKSLMNATGFPLIMTISDISLESTRT